MSATVVQPRRRWFGFPEAVNETAARTVAAGVALMAWAVALLDVRWLLAFLFYGFLVRVVAGSRYSPLALLATKVVAPRLGGRLVPGPPKRFAQSMGAAFALISGALFLAGLPGPARIVAGALAGAATLEAVFGFCIGCKIFAFGMRIGLVPERICEDCLVQAS